MSNAATIVAPDALDGLSPYALQALSEAAFHKYGDFPGPRDKFKEHQPELLDMVRRGLVYVDSYNWPVCTAAGRRLMGAPPHPGDPGWLEWVPSAAEKAARRDPSKPRIPFYSILPATSANENKDPRTPSDYNDYKTMGHFCVLVVKLGDVGPNARAMKVSMDGDPARFFWLPLKKMVPQPESREPFILTTVPRWLGKPDKLPQLMRSSPDLASGIDWTDEQRSAWRALQRRCESINVRIRDPKHGTRTRTVYGATA